MKLWNWYVFDITLFRGDFCYFFYHNYKMANTASLYRFENATFCLVIFCSEEVDITSNIPKCIANSLIEQVTIVTECPH